MDSYIEGITSLCEGKCGKKLPVEMHWIENEDASETLLWETVPTGWLTYVGKLGFIYHVCSLECAKKVSYILAPKIEEKPSEEAKQG